MIQCPTWCVADHAQDLVGARVHRGVTHEVAVVLEGRGTGGPRRAELLVEVSRLHEEVAVWIYLGDGWTGFSLSLESATRLSAAVTSALRAAGTLESTGL
ncbi:hypothetical protein GCM10011600_21020 [Pseudolysinimonas yzui]|uniref:Uncharacterized protein n=2 Tax=Pseudolysinimonas yzui TaxID=2708254 RepID=A0A8J3M2U3_9MICO|nr:hypothetical protein [Pseudolysinimonas yzui]GHF19927.1 hypothetical protein GCM10011600_21020 [Pseudolysinimonas yzui]